MTELYDPYSHQLQEDPYPTYRRLRDEYPVYHNRERDFWALTRFDDVWAAVHDPEVFSSAQGIVVSSSEFDAAGAFLPMMIMMDPPRHDDLRSLVNRAFTPRRIAAMEESVRAVAIELIDSFSERLSCDFVREFAAPLPTIVIADLIGVRREDRAQFRHWSDQLVQADPDKPELVQDALAAGAELYSYFATIVAERRKEPRDDLATALIEAEIDGQHLSEEELLGFLFLLLVAGNETTTNLITNGAVLLAQHPEARAELAENPSLIGGAVDEILRYDSPVQGLARTLTRDVTIHGETIPQDAKVLLVYGSANRDEREFADPDRFDIHRRIERSVAFGHGVHYCLGAALARLEGRVAYEELLGRFPDYGLDDPQNLERLHSGPIRGLLGLPMSFQAVESAPA